jgi:hypothetical protein
VGERDGYTVHENEVDLRMRDPEPFDYILDGNIVRDRVRKRHAASPWWKEVVQLSVEPDGDGYRRGRP